MVFAWFEYDVADRPLPKGKFLSDDGEINIKFYPENGDPSQYVYEETATSKKRVDNVHMKYWISFFCFYSLAVFKNFVRWS